MRLKREASCQLDLRKFFTGIRLSVLVLPFLETAGANVCLGAGGSCAQSGVKAIFERTQLA